MKVGYTGQSYVPGVDGDDDGDIHMAANIRSHVAMGHGKPVFSQDWWLTGQMAANDISSQVAVAGWQLMTGDGSQ